MARKPVSERLREAIAQSGKSRYRISMETGITQSQLSRFFNDPNVSLSLGNIDKLCEYLGAELVLKAEPTKPKRTKKPKRK